MDTSKNTYIKKIILTKLANIFLFNEKLWLYILFSLFFKSLLFIKITNIKVLDLSWKNYLLDTNTYLFLYIFFVSGILCFAFLLKNKFKIIFLLVINVLISTVLLIDIWYFRGFGNIMSVYTLFQTSNLHNLGEVVLSFIHIKDFIMIIDIPFLITYIILKRKKFIYPSIRFIHFLFFFTLSFGYISLTHYYYDHKKVTPGTFVFTRSWLPQETIIKLSPIGSHILDVYLYIKDKTYQNMTKQDKVKISKWYNANYENKKNNEYYGLFRGKNLICIQVESMENFVLNQKINGQEITPNINKLLKESFYFPEIYEQNREGNSSDSDLLFNTSVYPIKTGSTFFRYPNNKYNSLPNLLEKKGYTTVAAHPDKESYWNWMTSLKSIGFDKCLSEEDYDISESIGLGISDGSLFRQLIPHFESLAQPFYTFIVTSTSHGPFNLPLQYRELNLPQNLDNSKLGGYFQSINYTDKHIGLFIDSLNKKGLLDDTVIVIIGDHGGMHKYYPTEIEPIKPNEKWWFSGTRLPFIIYSKGLLPKKVDIKGGQVDFMPTLTYLMGINNKQIKNTAMGRNLLNTSRSYVVAESKKFICDKGSEKYKDHAFQGLEIGDQIIQHDYFKNISK